MLPKRRIIANINIEGSEGGKPQVAHHPGYRRRSGAKKKFSTNIHLEDLK